jgi:hypothetical protein
MKPYEPKPGAATTARPPPVGPQLIALAVALDQPTAEKRLMPRPEPDKEPFPEARLGYALGWALAGQWEQARHLAAAPGNPGQRLEALVAVAEIAATRNSDAGRSAIEPAVGILEHQIQGKSLPSWFLFRMVRAGAAAGMTDRLKPVVEMITDTQLRGRARLELEKARLAAGGSVDAQAIEAEAKKPDNPILLEYLCRQSARKGVSLWSSVDTWEPKQLRAYGYLGIALGEQDR